MLVRYKPNMGEFVMLYWGTLWANGRARTINLTMNSQFYVRQGDVERLIAQGYLQKLS